MEHKISFARPNTESIWFVMVQYLCLCSLCSSTKSNYKVPAIFAFGDSIVDSGNNNGLITLIRSNFPPYGQDFEDKKATGRFTNGRTPIDFLAEEFGTKKHLPAYLDNSLKDEDLLTGVSFASGGCGFDLLTCQISVVKSLDEQLQMFNEYITRIQRIIGHLRTNFIINNSFFFLVCGSNDVANTYFASPFRRNDYDFESYSDLLVSSAIDFIKKLHKLGVQNIFATGLPPIGYLPIRRSLAGGQRRDCVNEENEFSLLFNSKLEEELQNLRLQLPHSKLVYVDLFYTILDVVLNHTIYGFEVADTGCCGSGQVEVCVLCNSFSSVCDANKYVFWDSYHPTEKGYKILVRKFVEKFFG